MNKEQINEKKLAQELKAKLNSPEYVAIPEILGHDDRYGDMISFIFRRDSQGVHSEKRDNFIGDKSREKGERVIYEHQLEPTDWEEIVNLIEKKNKEKKEAFEKRWTQIQKILDNTPGLYYYWGKGVRKDKRADCWVEWKGMRGFISFFGKENGRTHYLYITEEHPILDNFSFEKGFYLINTNVPIEKNSPQHWSTGGEDNSS